MRWLWLSFAHEIVVPTPSPSPLTWDLCEQMLRFRGLAWGHHLVLLYLGVSCLSTGLFLISIAAFPPFSTLQPLLTTPSPLPSTSSQFC